MVDLSKAQAGDTVVFKCGGKWKIGKIEPSTRYPDSTWIRFEGAIDGLVYLNDGQVPGEIVAKNGATPFNIIAIEPKPFDWKDVKPGMAFSEAGREYGRLVYFIGFSIQPNSQGEHNPVWQHKGSDLTFTSHKNNYTRAPEHDIEVA